MLDSEFFGGLARPNAASRPSRWRRSRFARPAAPSARRSAASTCLSRSPPTLPPALREAWLDRLVLLFRGQYLDAAHYLKAARIFETPSRAERGAT